MTDAELKAIRDASAVESAIGFVQGALENATMISTLDRWNTHYVPKLREILKPAPVAQGRNFIGKPDA